MKRSTLNCEEPLVEIKNPYHSFSMLKVIQILITLNVVDTWQSYIQTKVLKKIIAANSTSEKSNKKCAKWWKSNPELKNLKFASHISQPKVLHAITPRLSILDQPAITKITSYALYNTLYNGRHG